MMFKKNCYFQNGGHISCAFLLKQKKSKFTKRRPIRRVESEPQLGMGRSPSPRRRDDRRREDRRERERRRPRTRSRSRSLERRRRSPRRSPSPRRRRSPSPGPSTSFAPKPKKTFSERPIVTPADLEGKSPEEQEMLKVMGFCGFDTTKGKKVEDNVEGDVHVVLKRKYRQYMNRKGGFNRPLDYVA